MLMRFFDPFFFDLGRFNHQPHDIKKLNKYQSRGQQLKHFEFRICTRDTRCRQTPKSKSHHGILYLQCILYNHPSFDHLHCYIWICCHFAAATTIDNKSCPFEKPTWVDEHGVRSAFNDD